jgi:hypothetical protein
MIQSPKMMISRVIFISLLVIYSVAFIPTAGARTMFISKKAKVDLAENCKIISLYLNAKPNTCLAPPVLDFRNIYKISNFTQEKNDWSFYHKNCEFITKKSNPIEVIIVFLCFITIILMIALDKNFKQEVPVNYLLLSILASRRGRNLNSCTFSDRKDGLRK